VEGMQADMTVVSLSGAHQKPVRDPMDALVFSSSGRDVLMTLVAGKEVYRDGNVGCIDEVENLTQIETVRTKLDSIKE